MGATLDTGEFVNGRQMLVNGPPDARCTLALAHGAAAPMDSPFMTFFAEGLAARGIRVVRFEFPYMAERRRSGARRLPDRPRILLDTWRSVASALAAAPLVIGGKSLGGRMASMLANELEVRGLACLGYPFHPPAKPDRVRVDHLRELRRPALILQGTRDPFGSPDEIAAYDLPDTVRLHWIEDGDHDLAPRTASGRTRLQNWSEALEVLADFVDRAASEPRR